MKKNELITEFSKAPLMGILRGLNPDYLKNLSDICKHSGLKFIEITTNTESFASQISELNTLSQGDYFVGAGTVLNLEHYTQAKEAGASFMVSPCLVPEVAQACLQDDVAYFPGALTPTEIWQCWQAGAAWVKVFPAKVFGPGYFKEIKGPLNNVRLLACGGVDAASLPEYLKNGADAAAFGGRVFSQERFQRAAFSEIEEEIKILIQGVTGKGNIRKVSDT